MRQISAKRIVRRWHVRPVELEPTKFVVKRIVLRQICEILETLKIICKIVKFEILNPRLTQNLKSLTLVAKIQISLKRLLKSLKFCIKILKTGGPRMLESHKKNHTKVKQKHEKQKLHQNVKKNQQKKPNKK